MATLDPDISGDCQYLLLGFALVKGGRGVDKQREQVSVRVQLDWLDEPGLSVEHDDRGGVVVTADPRLSLHQVRRACDELPDRGLSDQIQSTWAQSVGLSHEAK